jgi:hypothetical protein
VPACLWSHEGGLVYWVVVASTLVVASLAMGCGAVGGA